MAQSTPHSPSFVAKNSVSASPEEPTISADNLRYFVDEWIEDGLARQQSPRTLGEKRDIGDKLLWFLDHRDYEQCSTRELRKVFVYLANGHHDTGGRWGNPKMTKPLRPSRVMTYYAYLKSLFSFVVAEGECEYSPMLRVGRPQAADNQIQPFTLDQVQALIAAARSSLPRRNVAILMLMFDSGLRVSELCDLKYGDVNFRENVVVVLGKGNKTRVVDFGRAARKALWAYVREDTRDAETPLFLSVRGGPLKRSGILRLHRILGKAAGLQAVRCSPHTMRHSFATALAASGADSSAIQRLLGHSTLKMTMVYVTLARGDMKNQHRRHSPANQLKLK